MNRNGVTRVLAVTSAALLVAPLAFTAPANADMAAVPQPSKAKLTGMAQRYLQQNADRLTNGWRSSRNYPPRPSRVVSRSG